MDEFDAEDESLFGPSDNLLDEADNDEEDLDIYGLVSSYLVSSVLSIYLFEHFLKEILN